MLADFESSALDLADTAAHCDASSKGTGLAGLAAAAAAFAVEEAARALGSPRSRCVVAWRDLSRATASSACKPSIETFRDVWCF